MKLRLVDTPKSHAIPGSQGEILILHVNELQRRTADDIPSARPRLGVDSGLPACQSHAALLDLQTRRLQARHAAQGRGQIAQVRKPRTEPDGVNRVGAAGMQRDDLVA